MKKYIECVIKSFFTIISFFINKSFINIDRIFLLFIFISLYRMYYKYKNNNILISIFSIFISFIMILGKSFNIYDSTKLISDNTILSIISFIGYYYFYSTVISIIINKIDFKNENKKTNKKIFLVSLLTILLSWSVYVLAFYPGILSPDPSNQILQFFNVDTKYLDSVIQLDKSVKITNHHPVLHTVLLGGCVKIGEFINNPNLGIFLYTSLQIIFLSCTLSYTIYYLYKLNTPNIYLIFLLIIYSLVPHYVFYSMSLVKDTVYSTLIILYVIFLFDILYIKNDLKYTRTVILLLLISLFRNNGIFVIIFSFPLLLIYKKNLRKKLTTIFLIFICLFTMYNKSLYYLKIPKGSIREALSVPFQQTARLAKYKDIDNKDKKIIDKLLNYKTLKKRYNPNISDPVKNKFNKNYTKNDLINYFKVWLKYLFKYPKIYIDSFINNTYGYFYPNTNNWYIYYKFDSRITKIIDYHYNDFNNLRNILSTYGIIFPYIPVIGLISNIGFNTLVIFLICLMCIIIKNKKFLIVLSPLLISIIFCLLSPVNTYFRYATSYIFSVPLLINLFLCSKKSNYV